jgi:hypothetical protein
VSVVSRLNAAQVLHIAAILNINIKVKTDIKINSFLFFIMPLETNYNIIYL